MLNLLIPDYKLEEFQKLTSEEIKKLKTCALTDVEGNYLCTVMIPQTDFIKVKSEYLGQLSNSVAGKELSELKPVIKCESCGKSHQTPLEKARCVKDHNKVKV